MQVGKLDREITLEFKTPGQSGSGEPTETWGTPATVWAAVRPLSGREYYAALGAQIVAEETLVFSIRHRTDVRPGTTRIQYESRTYNIRRVAEVGRRDGLDIFADTVTA
jgi:SPP1 family predicted phage head-tail adaptor